MMDIGDAKAQFRNYRVSGSTKEEAKKLLKYYEYKITSSSATFDVLISLSLNDDSVIDAIEFHKLQALYLQVMANVRNVDRKIKLQTEENFQKTILDKTRNVKMSWNKNSWS